MINTSENCRRAGSAAIPGSVLLLLLLAGSCRHAPSEEVEIPPISIRTEMVRTSNYVIPVRCSGRLSAKSESRLSFKTGGIIEKIEVEEGVL